MDLFQRQLREYHRLGLRFPSLDPSYECPSCECSSPIPNDTLFSILGLGVLTLVLAVLKIGNLKKNLLFYLLFFFSGFFKDF